MKMGKSIENINHFFEMLPDRLRGHRIWITAIFLLLTTIVAFGIKDVVIDESLDAYFQEKDPVKHAYDKFRSIFGGDEYVYIVYQAKDKDIFSQQSMAALKALHDALADYRLTMEPGQASPLDHIDEVKSLINVKYMEGKNQALYSKNFVGDRLPETAIESEILRKKALAHPDFPMIYLSQNSEYGGIMIRTDFNAESKKLSQALDDEADLFEGTGDSFEISMEGPDTDLVEEETIPDIERSDVNEYPKFMKEIRAILDRPEFKEAFRFYPVGNPVFMDFFAKAVMEDMGRLMSLVLLLIIIMLGILFRSFSAVLWPVLIVVFTIIWTLGLIGHSGFPQSAMLQVIIFLALTVGIADTVHILSGYLFFRNQGHEHASALRAVIKKSGLACLLTSMTTAIGLLSLVFVPLKPICMFGIFAAVAVLLAFIFTMAFLPLMLDLWSPVSKKRSFEKDHFVLCVLKKIEHIGFRYSLPTIIIFSVFVVFMLIGFLRLEIDSNTVEIIKKGMPLRDAYTIVDDHMGGTGNMEVMLDFNKEGALKDPEVLFAMEDLQVFMETDKKNRIVKTMSLVNVVKESYKVLNEDDPEKYAIPASAQVLGQVLFLFENANPKDRTRLVTDDYAKARIGLNSKNVGSIEALQILNKVQGFIDNRFDHLKVKYPDLKVTLTGSMTLLAIMLDYLAWSQIQSFGIALVVISVILFLVLGSSKAGIAALASNLFPILTTFGLMGFFDIPLDADTLIIAPIIIGLAVDDTIHFLTHFRLEIVKSNNMSQSIVNAVRESGQAISFTSLILAAGFLVFLLSFHNGLSRFGIFASIAIISALICDLILLPALCKVFNVNFKRQIVR